MLKLEQLKKNGMSVEDIQKWEQQGCPIGQLIAPYLKGVDLTGADFSNADLTGANLRGATLSNANLTGADLRFTDLTGALLRVTNLTGAFLKGVTLSNADLSGANLKFTDLIGADFTGADLTGTCLDPNNLVPELTDQEILDAGLKIQGEYVYGYRTYRSIHVGSTLYKVKEDPYVAPYFSTCINTDCHPGIYLAGLDWLEKVFSGNSLVRCYCKRNELIHAGDKWRCKRLWVTEVYEKKNETHR